MTNTLRTKTRIRYRFILFIALLISTHNACILSAAGVDGFTEPFRTIQVAAPETGIISVVSVREGDRVEAGQILATLDNKVHLALLAIAEQSKEAKGRLEAAQADLKLSRNRLEKFEQLRLSGHAREEEVNRTRMELAVAESQVKSAREHLLIKQLEYEKIKVQLERRKIRSPIAGVITKLHKEKGEFVAPNNPDILTLVELDRLIATFSVLGPQAKLLKVDQTVRINFPETRRKTDGTIEFISPVIDAESGTILIKVCIENAASKHRSGERCEMLISEGKRK